MKKLRIVLSVLALSLFTIACAERAGVAVDDDPIPEAEGIGTSPSEPGEARSLSPDAGVCPAE